MSAAEDRLAALARSLDLPGAVRLSWPDDLEGDDVGEDRWWRGYFVGLAATIGGFVRLDDALAEIDSVAAYDPLSATELLALVHLMPLVPVETARAVLTTTATAALSVTTRKPNSVTWVKWKLLVSTGQSTMVVRLSGASST